MSVSGIDGVEAQIQAIEQLTAPPANAPTTAAAPTSGTKSANFASLLSEAMNIKASTDAQGMASLSDSSSTAPSSGTDLASLLSNSNSGSSTDTLTALLAGANGASSTNTTGTAGASTLASILTQLGGTGAASAAS